MNDWLKCKNCTGQTWVISLTDRIMECTHCHKILTINIIQASCILTANEIGDQTAFERKTQGWIDDWKKTKEEKR